MSNIIPPHRAGETKKHLHKSNTQAKENIGAGPAQGISHKQENSIDQLCDLYLGFI